MQTALHIHALVAEIRKELVGGTVVRTEWYKKERSAYLFIKRESSSMALGFVYHPSGSGFFVVPASKLRIDTREKPWPFFDLSGCRILDALQLGLDRMFHLVIEKENKRQHLLIEAIGPNGNMWLLSDEFKKQATLRKRDFAVGEPYERFQTQDKLNPFELTEEKLKNHAQQLERLPSMTTFAEKNLIGFNHTMARELVHRISPDTHEIDFASDVVTTSFLATVNDIARRFSGESPGYLYSIGGSAEVYPFQLSCREEPPEKFKTLSLAVLTMTARKQTRVEDADERKTTMDAVAKAITKLTRRISKLEEDVGEAADFEKFKRLGELLQINFGQLKRGMKQVRVVDSFSEPAVEITIPLDSALSPRDNSDAYFKRYRKGREGLELLRRRLEISSDELAALKAMQAELDHHFEQARERFAQELSALLPRESVSVSAQPRLPYREHQLSTGLTIYVGRDGSDNDRTTFEFARPYELWFHTSQCPGSHVVMKFPNKSFVPSKREIEETAAVAAFFSRAKNDSLVPVSYTERRYVRKPRQAKPGLVVIEREKSVMVTPKKPKQL